MRLGRDRMLNRASWRRQLHLWRCCRIQCDRIRLILWQCLQQSLGLLAILELSVSINERISRAREAASGTPHGAIIGSPFQPSHCRGLSPMVGLFGKAREYRSASAGYEHGATAWFVRQQWLEDRPFPCHSPYRGRVIRPPSQ